MTGCAAEFMPQPGDVSRSHPVAAKDRARAARARSSEIPPHSLVHEAFALLLLPVALRVAKPHELRDRCLDVSQAAIYHVHDLRPVRREHAVVERTCRVDQCARCGWVFAAQSTIGGVRQ